MISEIKQNLAKIQERIESACGAVGRAPGDVTLVTVTKTYPIETIRAAYDLGLRDFGESRLQEAEPKIEVLPADIRWHFIGTLQSNKAKKVANLFDVVHTLHSQKQLDEVGKSTNVVDGLIEVNIAHETQKTGLCPRDLEQFGKKIIECSQVHFRGLMTIGPALGDPEAMRPYFRTLRELNETVGGQWLSMGMSHDFDVAIQEGSTHIRVGTALFGGRGQG